MKRSRRTTQRARAEVEHATHTSHWDEYDLQNVFAPGDGDCLCSACVASLVDYFGDYDDIERAVRDEVARTFARTPVLK